MAEIPMRVTGFAALTDCFGLQEKQGVGNHKILDVIVMIRSARFPQGTLRKEGKHFLRLA
jgi:hypothetical protein